MTGTHTCTRGESVDIDIGKTDAGGGYRDHCRNTIKVEKRDSPSGLNGYKRYTHTFSRSCYVGGIYYNGVHQSSIKVTDAGLYKRKVTDAGLYKRKVTVYYLSYDDSNVLPLIVGLEKTWLTDQYYYYKKDDYFATSDQWKDEDRSVSQETQLHPKLPGISTKVKELVVLNLTKPNGTYYANGDQSRTPPTNPTLKIKVTEPPETIHTIYKRYKHSPVTKDTSTIRLLSTKTTSTNIPFESPIYRNEYSEAHVYFWEGDNRHRNPLLLELKPTSGASSYYILSGGVGKKWSHISVTPSEVIKVLDRENCRHNGAHIIDISKKGSYGRYISYPCPGCSSKWIGLSNHGTDYSYYYHYLHGGSSIRGFKDGPTEQSGITFSGRISSVFVYNYPSGPEGIPLLICLPYTYNSWFERTSVDSNTWKSVGGSKPTSTFDKEKILKILKAILPTVVINIGQGTGLSSHGSSITYSDSSEQIEATRQDLTGSFSSLSHSVKGKSTFILGGIKHNGFPLQGIPQNLVVKNVKAYYEGQDPENKEKLLVVGLEKRDTGSRNNHVYYSRETKTSIWKPDLQKNTKSGAPPLTTQLREIKEKLSAGKSQKSNGNESNAGAIAGGVFGSLTSGTAVGLGIWKGPAIVRSIITTFITSV
ncbi:hypothetical protein BEWA_039860 [Theileria equi strain WA]|uniref:Uncharacterized protein n=1 Tax=Theileria equi strain WA TaxID=1537102 RepID=L1LFL6_THEEQ|nr:hypothetical protein BEWA_039860 [Theileria equi strain WA]EKX73948.1 hypothetical protein BEWA_039860 [Theileria equi strain WA]|eukprot:XP_004833400.1 hypothetical protein BEWA_039860 [Theileria equi strain WA]